MRYMKMLSLKQGHQSVNQSGQKAEAQEGEINLDYIGRRHFVYLKIK